jgi:hypothetical protein
MSTTVKPWIESVHLHPDVLKEHAETDIFALDLGPLAESTGTVAPTPATCSSCSGTSRI